jgi:tetratricopeptide (TPR) repeat protein
MRGRNLVYALAVMLSATAALAQSNAQYNSQNNMIRGKVRAADGTTVNNAIVELKLNGGAMLGQTVTRNDGDFAFTGLQPAEYEIVVTIAGYEPAAQVARFSQSERMNFYEVLNVEVIIRPRAEPVLGPPGTSFAQDVPRAARAAFEKGMSRLREGKSDEGLRLLGEATTIFNEYFDAHYEMGKELFREGKDEEALKELERARQINDRQYAVYYTFGLVMLKQRKYNVADYAFGEAIRLNANSAPSYYYHGLVLIELALVESEQARRDEKLKEAEKELNRAWEISAKRLYAVHLQRARIYERRGDKQAAARELESYLKAEPDAKNAAAIRAAIAKLRSDTK